MKTMLYEFITISDPITFRASNNSIAFVVATALGQGKAGCENRDTGESIDSMTASCLIIKGRRFIEIIVARM